MGVLFSVPECMKFTTAPEKAWEWSTKGAQVGYSIA